ncbi:MAG: MlaD family protein [Saprospiraceae bacterium]|nr:MlaD family protein [Saprospiraceae bacterium]
MAKTAFNDIRLGLFVILALAVFTYALYRVSNKADLFKGSMDIIATFEDVRGLQPGNNVRFAGINIGSVEDIRLQGDTMVVVIMNVVEDATTYMRKDAIATIGSNGLVGNMLVNITPGPGKSDYITHGDTIASTSGRWTAEMMGNLSTTSTDLTSITSNLNQIVHKINKGQGTLSLLLNDESMAEDMKGLINDLRQSGNELRKVSRKANDIMKDLDHGKGVLGKLISDTIAADKIDKLLSSMDTMVSTNIPMLMSELQKSGKNLSSTTEQLKSVIDNLDQKGLTGSLLNDTERVHQLEAIMTNLEEGTAKFNTSMEALQNHWLLRKSVKKLEEKNE